ncbi:CDP-alcohol phosphatidyltransferase family protein [Pasteurella atlantica]|uniref:CDP-diacylglycerol--glycerol-3-phosphate 3-phosphatidyltransferase n=1 Tax=Phocoenobacter skyensis TaxID=97481 RepID=A0A1H7VNT7_9PAST|nr:MULTISPECIES: CDP-alcohol phosphatidyltransferase family protein [Pasteurella]MDP8033321.1 CDP-alcohol phosphatidyltransferase family protein [Pasteurella atlantica]MDP8035130.1 CDP-alcohol phosphatidyltransferase family protein [Pasteurella atlantica]MDP8037079.1 CDP-alcohol phosphatidyltransferase family protein [Pasteurella atlantica]MDP8047266.1 CDP-alcohol phosphatidyltransferase family protein [Pasteurella atlantica]MDP8049509.1 CDP-alcohol phosphatidyltransferase family protein [Past
MTIYDLKPKFQQLLMPLVNILHKKGISPNQVTIMAILLSALGGLCVLASVDNTKLLLLIPVILFVRMALNAIDGLLAKEFNQKTKFGAVLNELGDVISDSFLYLPFVYILDPVFVVIFVVLAILSEFSGVLSWAIIGERRYNGPMGKSDRAFLLGLLSVLIAFFDAFYIANILLSISIILLLLTIYNRSKNM